jgi:uncharacterized protein HemX
MLFANSDAAVVFLVLLAVAIGIGSGCYKLYMMIYHPEEWAATQQRNHERKLQAERLKAMQEMQKREQEEAARQKRNSLLLGVGTSVFRAFFGR